MGFLEQFKNGERLAKWDIKAFDVWLFICFASIGSFLLSGIFTETYSYLTGSERDMESLPFLLASGFGFQLSALFAWLLFKQVVAYETSDMPAGSFTAIKTGAIGFLCVYLFLIPTMILWRAILDATGIEYAFQLPVLLAQNGGTPIEMTLMFCLVVFVAPICEELIYRGFLFRYFHKRMAPGIAIFASSAIFALMHWNIYSFVPLLLLACALCIVYRATGNLLSSIVLHALFNLVNLLTIYLIEPIEL